MIVSNASPLISPAKIESLAILPQIFSTVHIAEQVQKEITRFNRAGAEDLTRAEWIKVVNITDAQQFERWKKKYRLGAGETATLLLAKEQNAETIIMDERKARKLAAELGLNVVGTLGILEEAYRRNFIADLHKTYQDLIATGRILNPAFYL